MCVPKNSLGKLLIHLECRHLYSVPPVNASLLHTVISRWAAIATTSCHTLGQWCAHFVCVCLCVVLATFQVRDGDVSSTTCCSAWLLNCSQELRRCLTALHCCRAEEVAAQSQTISLALFNPQRQISSPASQMPHYDQVSFAEATFDTELH